MILLALCLFLLVLLNVVKVNYTDHSERLSMKPIRLKSNAFYHKLDEIQRRCYNAGLPIRYMGKKIEDLDFVSYTVGENNRKIATAATQQRALAKFVNELSLSENYNAILAIHSSPTDEAAFQAAATIFKTAISRGLSACCLSTSQLLSRDLPDPKEVYVIHSVTETNNPQAIWALRDFLRDRDGSLRIVIMTSGKDPNVEDIVHEQMRMQFDYLYCLSDSVEVVTDRRPTFRNPVEKVVVTNKDQKPSFRRDASQQRRQTTAKDKK
jgi:hypothetical protein